jgi:DNA-directed RNA polymerase specialized sigma24 family protein
VALPEPERSVCHLRWYGGLPLAEVAAVLQISERTAKRHWQAARLRLGRAFEGEAPR